MVCGEPRDRPVDDDSEIELTPEMIAAGATTLACFNPLEDSSEVFAEMIFEDMIKARKPQSVRSCGRSEENK